MGTEALKQRAVRASCCDACDWPKCGCETAAGLFDKMMSTIAPPDVLSWVSAHPEAAKGLAEGTMVAVPREPTEVQWGGLARDVIMWTRFSGQPTGKALYKHLRSLGREVPNWMLQEINDTDRVPSKGTVAVVIYKLMLAASTLVTSDEAQGEISADDAEFGMSDHRPGWEPCVEVTCTYSFAKNGRGCPRCGKLMVDFGD